MSEDVRSNSRIYPIDIIREWIDSLRYAHQFTSQKFYTIIKINAAFVAVMFVVYVVSLRFVLKMSDTLAYTREWQYILLNLIALPFLSYLVSGLLAVYRNLTRGQDQSWTDIFKGHKTYLRVLGYCIVYYFFYRTLVRTVVDIEDYPVDLRIRLALGVPLFIWVASRICFAFAYVVEEDNGPKQAIKKSFLLTTGRFWRTLVVMFPFPIFLSLVGLSVGALPHPALVLAAMVIVLAALPYSISIIFCVYYRQFDAYRGKTSES